MQFWRTLGGAIGQFCIEDLIDIILKKKDHLWSRDAHPYPKGYNAPHFPRETVLSPVQMSRISFRGYLANFIAQPSALVAAGSMALPASILSIASAKYVFLTLSGLRALSSMAPR